MTTLFGGDGMRIRLARVLVAIGEFGRGNCRHHEGGTEAVGKFREQSRSKARDVALFLLDARGSKLPTPELSVPRLSLRKLKEEVLAERVRFRRRDRRIKRGSVELIAQIVAIALDVFGSHGSSSRSSVRGFHSNGHRDPTGGQSGVLHVPASSI